MRTAGGPIRIALALALAALLAACGARETEQAAPDPPTFAPPTATTYQQVQVSATAPPPPPVTLQPATLTAAAAEGALQATAQALSLILTASPASAEGYTAIALYETAITAATQSAIPPEQRRPTPDPTQLAGVTSVPTVTTPPFTPGPDTQATDIASMQLTGEAATATRAADYTATALVAD